MAFTFSSTSGSSGISSVVVSATSNNTSESVVGNYQIENSGKTINMTVVQKGYKPVEKYFSISPSSLSIDAKGGNESLMVSSNDKWVIHSNDWIELTRNGVISSNEQYHRDIEADKINTLSGEGNTIIGIFIYENKGENRSGYISGCCENDITASASTTVSQVGGYQKPYLYLDTYEINVGNNSGTTSVTITSNVEWSASTDERWITLLSSVSSGNGSVSIIYDANNTNMARKGLIAFTTMFEKVELVIEQLGVEKNYIVVNPTQFNVSSTGSSGNVISVSANCEYGISTETGWINLGATSGHGNGIVSFSTQPSSKAPSEVGVITFDDKESVTADVFVYRNGVDKYLSGSTETLEFDLSGGRGMIDIISNVEWAVNADFGNERDWFTLSTYSGSGDGSIIVSVDSSLYKKTGYISIYNQQYGLDWIVEVVVENQNDDA